MGAKILLHSTKICPTMKLNPDDQGPLFPPLVRVLVAIKEAVPSERDNQRDWRLHVKRSMAALGRRCGWEVRQYEQTNPDACAWLFEHTWTFTMDHRLRDIALVMEVTSIDGSYWNLISDFEKLLAARSQLKIIAFAADETERKDCFVGLGLSLRAYIHIDPTEVYILACWKPRERAYDIRTWQNGCFSGTDIE